MLGDQQVVIWGQHKRNTAAIVAVIVHKGGSAEE
jgi:hypothetical protein